ncbi:peptidoglycan DD-metalloendopeptidase family protein [Mailhella sp.]|uniref:peptidoglycan DD-metalloendopeptidase family protein n=1 Tax=Mailhella sp. TaxID=1981029 RepID=UPI004064B71D
MSAGNNAIQPVPLWKSAVLLCVTLSLTACLPKDMFLVSSEQAHTEAVQTAGDIDAQLSIDRELEQASLSPSSLVGSDNLSVSALAEHHAPFGESLELSEDAFSFLPAGLMMLEGPGTDVAPQYSASSTSRVSTRQPAYGSAEERALAAINTRQALCRPGDKICMTSPYGVRRGKRIHKGIDIRAPLGSPIMAFRSGVVTRAQYNRTYGYMVDIQQDDGLVARYAHMSQILTRKGARVTPGLRIGRVGSTGRSTGPHLHFELLRDNRQTNPMAYLHTLDYLVKLGTEEDMQAARHALSKTGPHKKGKARRQTDRKHRGKVNYTATSHKVRSGDTLYDIARDYGTSVRAIQAANGGADSLKTLRPGKTIKLPPRSTKTAQK